MEAMGMGHNGGRKRMKTKADESSFIVQTFRGFQVELDLRHDKYERIVKLSRDITVESKRIIFLLQRYVGAHDKDQLMQQAKEKLTSLQQTKFLQLARELYNEDHYQFLRAYSPGLQEYIEAVAFHHYLQERQLVSLAAVQADLRFLAASDSALIISSPVIEQCLTKPTQIPAGSLAAHASLPDACDVCTSGPPVDGDDRKRGSQGAAAAGSASVASIAGASKRKTSHADERTPGDSVSRSSTSLPSDSFGTADTDVSLKLDGGIQKHLMVTVPLMDFILGISDLTGELMRSAIMSVSEGDLDFPIAICKFMRLINTAFVSFGNVSRELTRKLSVLQQSLVKVEDACCTLRVRGSEIPKHMLATIFSCSTGEGQIIEEEEVCFD